MLIEEIKKLDRFEVFDVLLKKLSENKGKSITFTRNKMYPYDNFLIFSSYSPKQVVTFKRPSDLWYVLFDGDDPMLLEDCPDSFYRSILLNLP